MVDAKHTPGPWSVGYSVKGCAVYMKPISEGWLVRDQIARFPRTAEGEANARLLAAAPNLLVALQMSLPALEWCEKQWASSPQHGDGVNVLTLVRSVLASVEA